MTENEQKLFDNLMEHNSAYYGYELSKGEIKTVLQAFEQLKQYRAIGTIEELQELKEKSVAKKATEIIKDEIGYYHCPHCKNTIGTSLMVYQSKHCSYCGQRLDWQ